MAQARNEPLNPQSGAPTTSKLFPILLVLLILVLVLIIFAIVVVNQHDRISTDYIGLTGEQRLLSRSVIAHALEASRGKEEAFEQLKRIRDRFDAILAIQKEGDDEAELPPSPAYVMPYVQQLEEQWIPVRTNADDILQSRDPVLSVSDFVPLLEGLIPQLLELSDKVADQLIENSAPANRIYDATRQLLLGQRMESNLSRMLTGGVGAATAADQFGADVKEFGRVLKSMDRGGNNVAAAEIGELVKLFQSIEDQAGRILRNSPELFQAQNATQGIVDRGNGLLQATEELLQQYHASAERGYQLASWLPAIGTNTIFALAFIAVVLLGLLAWLQRRDAKFRLEDSERRKQDTEEQNRRNQEAILRLLDELGDLAEGDLTVQASVTEDITGAIADSVNYAIEALRDLVSTINNTSEQMAAAAQETRSIAERLARASEVQAQQIESSSSTVMQMAQFMDEVSGKTASSSEVAEKSVNIAHTGAQRVRSTIQGMDAIREHIQETSKRIKRLGESSQEIGDIVALINDIADQTNILALNAAIQASAAGDAGRGFAVVADEVQRLAERSGNATKRIETLVKTIQADTNEAIISMEKSTTEVVNGAELAEKAGEALEEIETVSANLAGLITDVSKAAGQVTEMASRVSTAMTSINEITAQTSESTAITASSIGKLNQLAQELQQSVAGFRLPEQAMSNP